MPQYRVSPRLASSFVLFDVLCIVHNLFQQIPVHVGLLQQIKQIPISLAVLFIRSLIWQWRMSS